MSTTAADLRATYGPRLTATRDLLLSHENMAIDWADTDTDHEYTVERSEYGAVTITDGDGDEMSAVDVWKSHREQIVAAFIARYDVTTCQSFDGEEWVLLSETLVDGADAVVLTINTREQTITLTRDGTLFATTTYDLDDADVHGTCLDMQDL